VVAVIELLADRPTGATLTEIAGSLGLSRPSCVHLLAALTASGFLVREPDDRRYHLGPALVHPGRVAQARYPLLAAARPEMLDISRELGHPCLAFEPAEGQARLVHHTWAPGSTPIAVRLGETVPLKPPLGLVLVAWGGPEDFDRWLDSAELTDEQRERHRTERAAVRELGFVAEAAPEDQSTTTLAGTLEERPSPYRDRRLHRLLTAHDDGAHVLVDLAADRSFPVSTIGAPVLDRSGRVSLSLSLVVFQERLSGAEICEMGARLRTAADAVAASAVKDGAG
jgi:DNA-binding IclR family transcriptional regulator